MSRKAPTDAPKKCLFCEVRQGGGAYGKSASGAAFPGVSFFAHMFFPGLSPGSVDNRVSVFEKGESARRSRTTERSESVSEEAPELAFSPYASVRHFTPDMAHFSYNPH